MYKNNFSRVANDDTFYQTKLETEHIRSLNYDNSVWFVRHTVPFLKKDTLYVAIYPFGDSPHEAYAFIGGTMIKLDSGPNLTGSVGEQSYAFPVELLEKACEDQSFSLRFSTYSDKTVEAIRNNDICVICPYLKLKHKVSFQTYLQAVYNALYDDTAYLESAKRVQLSFLERLFGTRF